MPDPVVERQRAVPHLSLDRDYPQMDKVLEGKIHSGRRSKRSSSSCN
ncbi:MAG: hypothetical protein ACJ74Z_17690 [Bryobacteraceae bacterium]